MEGGRCREQCIVYQATVTTSEPGVDTETYTGMTKPKFKERYGNHKKSFNHREYSNETTLSNYVWRLKERNIGYDIQWKVVDKAPPFNPVSGVCALCTTEKYHIIFNPEKCNSQ